MAFFSKQTPGLRISALVHSHGVCLESPLAPHPEGWPAGKRKAAPLLGTGRDGEPGKWHDCYVDNWHAHVPTPLRLTHASETNSYCV